MCEERSLRRTNSLPTKRYTRSDSTHDCRRIHSLNGADKRKENHTIYYHENKDSEICDEFVINKARKDEAKKVAIRQYNQTKKLESKKRRLRLTLSCPGFLSCTSTEISPSDDTSRLLIQVPSPVMERNDVLFNSNSSSWTNIVERDTITSQPTNSQYKNFVQKDVNDNCKRRLASNNSLCSQSCLFKAKSMVQWCTCFWCFNSLCYHCVNKDDVGGTDKILTCNGSLKKNLKRFAITTSCLPCLPCLSLYPILNGTIDLFISPIE